MPRRTKAQLREELLQLTEFRNKELEQLADIASTRELQFQPGAVFPQTGLRHLRKLHNLQLLALQGSELSQRQLTDIGKIASLRKLDLQGCRFPAKGLAALGKLPLTGLSLERTDVGNGALDHVLRIASLEVLVLTGTRVDDRGLKKLARMPVLRELILRDTGVTDDGMRHLAAAPKVELAEGYVRGTAVTLAGLEAAAEARGRQQIEREKRQRTRQVQQGSPAEQAAAAVTDFIARMHRWERKAARQARQGAAFEEILAGQRELFGRCCTARELKLGRYGTFADPPEYDPETETILQTEKRGRRFEVLARRSSGELRLYSVVEQGGRWRIEGVQTSRGGAFRPGQL